MPTWARWRTIRDNLWHIADTESRYYLPSLDLPSKEREPDLETELRASATHVDDQAVPLQETIGAFTALQEEGLVRVIAASNLTADWLRTAVAAGGEAARY